MLEKRPLRGRADKHQTAHGGKSVLILTKKFCQFTDGGRGICSQGFKTGDTKLLKSSAECQRINSIRHSSLFSIIQVLAGSFFAATN